MTRISLVVISASIPCLSSSLLRSDSLYTVLLCSFSCQYSSTSLCVVMSQFALSSRVIVNTDLYIFLNGFSSSLSSEVYCCFALSLGLQWCCFLLISLFQLIIIWVRIISSSLFYYFLPIIGVYSFTFVLGKCFNHFSSVKLVRFPSLCLCLQPQLSIQMLSQS